MNKVKVKTVNSYADKALLHGVSEGIKSKRLSNADLISFSNTILTSAKKRKSMNPLSSPIIERPVKLSTFTKLSFDHRKGGSNHAENIENDVNCVEETYITENSVVIDSPERNSFGTDTYDNYDYSSQQNDPSNDYYDEVDAAEPTTDLPSQCITVPSVSPADQMKQLKGRAGKAVMYQLLHILNHGSLSEVSIVWPDCMLRICTHLLTYTCYTISYHVILYT